MICDFQKEQLRTLHGLLADYLESGHDFLVARIYSLLSEIEYERRQHADKVVSNMVRVIGDGQNHETQN
jgi:hypothetical protein